MKLAIVGSRTFTDYELLKDSVFKLNIGKIDWIVSGGAKGADSLAARFSKDYNIQLIEYLPDWRKYGKRAGFIRNELIIKDADWVLSFWNGLSRGAAHSLGLAKKFKKPTTIIYF